MVNWLSKKCPRCNGNLYVEDSDTKCLQCGYIAHGKKLPLVVEKSLV